MVENTTKHNIRKLGVGLESIDDLRRIQDLRFVTLGYCCAYTTQRPKLEKELIEKGSLYWIIKGKITARQKITGFEAYIDDDDRKRTLILLDKEVVETLSVSHRPFQGWRYLADADVPQDLNATAYKDIPKEALAEMQELGIL